jgi:hypothetical protein
MTKRRRLLWSVLAVLLALVVLRFAIRWADATGRLASPGELVVWALLIAVAVGGAVLLARRGQTRKNR